MNPLLRAIDLSKRFTFRPAVEGVAFDLYPGEVLGVVENPAPARLRCCACCPVN
jgi:ABC-type phosphonate transport system ATPase subunit